MTPMQDVGTLFADYAVYHRTAGNKWCHRFGIPMIMLGGLGMLARIPIVPYLDAAVVLIAVAAVVYFILDWRLAAMMVIVSILFYFAGAALPFWVNVAVFVIGWILQFVGHSVYEKRQPAFLTNALHLLVGPMWILNDVIHVVPATRQPATTS